MLLALDPSTTAVGWALFDGNRYVKSGVFKPVGGADDRIVAVADWLRDSFSFTEWLQIDDITCELPTGDYKNMDTNRKLGGVYYLCMYVARQLHTRFHAIYPKHVIATGVGKRNLEAAQAYIRDATGDETREVGPDEADALAVALAFLKLERRWT